MIQVNFDKGNGLVPVIVQDVLAELSSCWRI